MKDGQPTIAKLLIAAMLPAISSVCFGQSTQHNSDAPFATDHRSFAVSTDKTGETKTLWQGDKSDIPQIFKSDAWIYVDWKRYDYGWKTADRRFRTMPHAVWWDHNHAGLYYWLYKQEWYKR